MPSKPASKKKATLPFIIYEDYVPVSILPRDVVRKTPAKKKSAAKKKASTSRGRIASVSGSQTYDVKAFAEPIGLEGKAKGTIKKVDVTKLRDQMLEITSSMGQVLDGDALRVGNFHLKTVQFTAEVTASGTLGIIIGSAGIGAKGGITFVFERED
jgi:hypothetical protein